MKDFFRSNWLILSLLLVGGAVFVGSMSSAFLQTALLIQTNTGATTITGTAGINPSSNTQTQPNKVTK